MTRKQNDRLRDKFYTTSSAIQSIYPKPSAGSSSRILQHNGGALIGQKDLEDSPCPFWKSQALLHAVHIDDNEMKSQSHGELRKPPASSHLSANNRTKLLAMALKNVQGKYSNSRDRRFAARGNILGQ